MKLRCDPQAEQNLKTQSCPNIIVGLFTVEGGTNIREIRTGTGLPFFSDFLLSVNIFFLVFFSFCAFGW